MIVFTNGCFDTLHAGHVQMLQYGRYLAGGDAFYVGIDSDARVHALKGQSRPYFNEGERISMLMRLTSNGVYERGKLNRLLVDWVDTFDDDKGLYTLIKRIAPDYILKGDEWRGRKVIGDDVAPVLFYPTFQKHLCSTSEIERRILQSNLIHAETQAVEKACQAQRAKKRFVRPVHWRRNR